MSFFLVIPAKAGIQNLEPGSKPAPDSDPGSGVTGCHSRKLDKNFGDSKKVPMFGKVRTFLQKITRILGYIGMFFVIPMMLLTSADATGRDFFSRPVRGAFEMNSLVLSVFVLLGLAYTQQMKDHVRVTIVLERLPQRLSAAINIFTTLLCMFIVAIMCWQGIVVAFEASAVTDMLRIPQLPFRLLVTLGGLFLFLEFFFDLVDHTRRFIGMMADPTTVGALGALIVVILIFLGMHIAFAMMFVGFVGICALASLDAAMPVTASTMWEVASFYPYTVIPLFIIMGSFAGSSGMTRDLYSSFEKWTRRVPGGLAVATIGACGAFAAVSGSSVATAAAMGTVALPEMERFKYDPRLSTGSVAAGGTLGFLIPPSIGFVVYGMLTEQSIGKLLISGILPGILLTFSYDRRSDMGKILAGCSAKKSGAGELEREVQGRERREGASLHFLVRHRRNICGILHPGRSRSRRGYLASAYHFD